MIKRNKTFILGTFFVSILISACGGSGGARLSSNTTDLAKNIYTPAPLSTFQWDLQDNNKVNTSYDVDVYDIDLFDNSKALIGQLQADGKKVICYFSAGSYEDARSDKSEFIAADLGKDLEDWEGERWLDIRSDNVKRIMKIRLDLAKKKGCDGVEPDNVDGYARQNDTGFPLTANDQLVYNRFLAKEAHARGLSVGLKNDLDQITELVDYFDFAVNEECHEYEECSRLDPFIQQNKAVFNVEYKNIYKNNKAKWAELCTDAATRKLTTLVLPLMLNDSFRKSCL